MSEKESTKVLYDAQIFTSQKFGGISRYFVELMKNMPYDISTDLSASFSHNIYLPEVKDIRDFPSIPFKKDLVKMLNHRRSVSQIVKGDFDVFHPTYYNPYFLEKLKRPFVITVHDMIHERFPESFSADDPTRECKRRVVFAADHIIAISQSTKNDLIEMYNLPEDKISVVYHGQTLVNPDEEPVSGLPQHYILFVGDRNRYKNFERMARAYSVIRKSFPEIKLVCTGRPFKKHELEMFAKLGIEKDVCRFFVNDRQLRYLYSHAICFVFPSLFEGFGFPVLEAYAAGCPIVLSNTSSLPEIAGEGGMYFDPTDIEDISSKIIKVIEDPQLRDDMTKRGREIAKNFTWQRTAAQTAEIYRKLV